MSGNVTLSLSCYLSFNFTYLICIKKALIRSNWELKHLREFYIYIYYIYTNIYIQKYIYIHKYIYTHTHTHTHTHIYFLLFRAVPVACGDSQAGLNQGYSCWPMPQQLGIWAISVTYTTAPGNAKSSTHWVRPGIEPASSWVLVRFVNMMGTLSWIIFKK